MSPQRQNWKPKALKIVNPILALLLLVQFVTALSVKVMGYELFSSIHRPSGIFLFLGGLFHVYLNWNWVKVNFYKRKG